MIFEDENFIWGWSEKSDGNMKPDLAGRSNYESNRKDFFDKLSSLHPKELLDKRVYSPSLSHSNRVRILSVRKFKYENTDALISDNSNVIICATFADCLPIYYFDATTKSIGLAHAGWRGVELGLHLNVLDKMIKNFESRSKDIKIVIGPHIKVCHFQIDANLFDKSNKKDNYISKKNKNYYFNLEGKVKKELEERGVKPDSIRLSEECTHCSNKYFSYRRDKPTEVQAQLAFIFLKE